MTDRLAEQSALLDLEEIERRVHDEGRWEGRPVQTARDGRRITVDSR